MKRILFISIILLVLSTGCAKQQPIDETMIAQKTLTMFFDNLNKGKITKALEHFTDDETTRESLNIYNPEREIEHADMIENYCQATLTCLPITIVDGTKVNDDEYQYTVQFKKEDGSIFVLGPCCGATEEEMPPKDTFNFTVKKIDGTFKVTTPPIYVP